MTLKKKIVLIGWMLIALLVIAYFAVMLVATFSGNGASPLKLIPGGRGGSQFAVAALPLLIILMAFGIYWLRRVLRRRGAGDRPVRR